ncbi:MAG: GNAT family protein [Phycisphaerales bacterium]|jgi:RimJ/RimL family protein N-acetyltransferase
MTIVTPRLELVSATVGALAAALDGPEPLAAHLGAQVLPTWPPEFLDPPALRYVMDRVRERPGDLEWWMYFMVLRDEPGGRVLVGSAGYKGPPTDDGTVEVGYGVVADRRRRGLASEAVGGLLDRAFAEPKVRRVIAETMPELVGSIGVLRRCGFRFIGDGSEPGVIRFELMRRERALPGGR